MYSELMSIISYFLQLCAFLVILLSCIHGLDRQEYIVYMGHLKPSTNNLPSLLHWNFLQNTLGSTTSATITYSYKHSFNGFVALLTVDEVKLISSREEVVSVFPNGNNELYTTNSWDFMGFPQDVKRATLIESNMIIGVIDSGIWPEADSFKDTGFGPPPTKWKGSCRRLTNFTCNNKIIGARYYKQDGHFRDNELQSPRDTSGHGTHVASIIVGGHISSANMYGLANGTARGGVPSSRIAVYKVCWSDVCSDGDILAAFDDAIQDGVDIISLSIGKAYSDYFQYAAEIGSFHAMRVGIMTSASAGNRGPGKGTVGNASPWLLTVAASTTNRKFVTNMKLGNDENFQGTSVNTFDQNDFSPIVYGGDVAKSRFICHVYRARKCLENSLNHKLVEGKILLCDQPSQKAAILAGATGVVVQTKKNVTYVSALPGTMVNQHDGKIILNYIKNTRNATAIIMKSHEVIDEFAPYIDDSSSRGPNIISLDILKPDLCAPGINILAASIPTKPVSNEPFDKRRSPYIIKSGTSMACPHVSAVAAYVKSFNPSWSPAIIKSALMTTASEMNPETTIEKEFGYGAGHLNPNGALNPGLVYDANEENYIQFLCGQGYDEKKLQKISGDKSTCKFKNKSPWNLNLPSFTYHANALKHFNITFHRTVTNVGLASSTYSANIGAPPLLKMRVVPNTLSFSSVGQTQSFILIATGVLNRGDFVSTYLSWTDGTHKVRSPIVIYC